MIHHRLKRSGDLSGFALKSAREGDTLPIGIKGFITSNDAEFYEFIQPIYDIFLQKFISLTECNFFLILRHTDKSADVYINDFQRILIIRAKNEVVAGSAIRKEDIADITDLKFQNIPLLSNDAIMFCFRVGWKFGLYFNFTANSGDPKKDIDLDLTLVHSELGQCYRWLIFEEQYRILENSKLFDRMFFDGWFPFNELLGVDYQELSRLYSNQWLDNIDKFLERFDRERINRIVARWWNKPTFKSKQPFIDAGVSAFLEGDDAGYKCCIQTLYSQIEGIIRIEYFKQHNHQPSFDQLKEFTHLIANKKFPSKESLGFPEYFYDYLNRVFLRNFDFSTGKIPLSRHSVAHGVALSEDFTKSRALQAILILNQIYFYL